jgi:hypothetical protein
LSAVDDTEHRVVRERSEPTDEPLVSPRPHVALPECLVQDVARTIRNRFQSTARKRFLADGRRGCWEDGEGKVGSC